MPDRGDNRGIVPREKRKVIYTGLDTPVVDPRGPKSVEGLDLAYHLDRIKYLPFDGMTPQIWDPDPNVPYPQNILGNNLFSGSRQKIDKYVGVLPQLQKLKNTPFKENFFLIAPCYWFESGKENKFDWFDEERWRITEDNLRDYAQLARRSGVVRGFVFDYEPYSKGNQYAYNIFSLNIMYNQVNQAQGKGRNPKEAYLNLVRQRGIRFLSAIDDNLPGAPILLYLGNAWMRETQDPNRADLFPAFLDGILTEIDRRKSKCYVIDGYEGAYKFRSEDEYRKVRNDILNDFKKWSTVPRLYEKYVRVGFGKWLDAGKGGDGAWNGADIQQNYYKPDDWEKSLDLALDYADEYVWVWGSSVGRVFSMNLNRNVNVPTAYINATRRAKRKGVGGRE